MDGIALLITIASGIAITVISAAIIGAWKWFAKKREDKVRLEIALSQPGDLQVQEFVGCACMIVTITCKSKRPAKIKGALIAIEGVDLIPDFERAFGTSFGHIPVKNGPPPALTIGLVPLNNNSADSFCLERDDAIRFAMPIRVPILDMFPKAPSQNVWIAVTYLDGSEEILLRGLQIQKTIEALISVWGKQKQTLKVNLEIGLRTTSAVVPDVPELMGTTNPNPVVYTPSRTPESGQCNKEGEVVGVKLPVYTLVSPDGQSAVLFQDSEGYLIPIFSTLEIAQQFSDECSVETRVKELATGDSLRSFVEVPPTTSGVRPPHFNILFHSIGPDGLKQGVVTRECILSTVR